MSDYEKHIGTIEKVNFNGTIEEFAGTLDLGELPDFYDNWEEYFRDESEEYHIHNDSIYRIQNEEIDNSDDIFEYKINNNKIEYVLSFYNGGTDLCEQIQDILGEVGSNLSIENESEGFIWKEDIEEVSYSDDFWYALTNGYIDLDNILVDNNSKEKLKEAISIVEEFQQELESQDFFYEM
jgi:hypothetical protein